MKSCTFIERGLLSYTDVSPRSSKVDREAKAIRGVRVLGLLSINTPRTLGLSRADVGDAFDRPYRYDSQAVRNAIPKYEGAKVFLNHPAMTRNPDGSRKVDKTPRGVESVFGRLENVRFSQDGLFADLVYLESHPACARLLEMAERMPEQIALSHNAACHWDLRNGELVATEILAVHSVDLIGDRPGTTRNLFESSDDPSPPAGGRTMRRRAMEAIDGDMGTPGAMRHNNHLHAHPEFMTFRKACEKTLDADNLSDAQKVQGLRDLFAQTDHEEDAGGEPAAEAAFESSCLSIIADRKQPVDRMVTRLRGALAAAGHTESIEMLESATRATVTAPGSFYESHLATHGRTFFTSPEERAAHSREVVRRMREPVMTTFDQRAFEAFERQNERQREARAQREREAIALEGREYDGQAFAARMRD